MAQILAFHRSSAIVPTPGARPDYLQETCARIQRAIGCVTPTDLRQRLERFDADQLHVVQIIVAGSMSRADEFSRPPMLMHLVGVVVGAIERGVRS